MRGLEPPPTPPLLLNDLEEHQTLRDDLLVECGKLKAQYKALQG